MVQFLQLSTNGAPYAPLGGGGGDLVLATLATASNATANTTSNNTGITFNIPLAGADATPHHWTYQIAGLPILSLSASGDGTGSIPVAEVFIGDSSVPVGFFLQSGDQPLATGTAPSFNYQGGKGGDAGSPL